MHSANKGNEYYKQSVKALGGYCFEVLCARNDANLLLQTWHDPNMSTTYLRQHSRIWKTWNLCIPVLLKQIMRLLEFSLKCWSEPWPGTLSAGWPDTEDSVQRSNGNKNEERVKGSGPWCATYMGGQQWRRDRKGEAANCDKWLQDWLTVRGVRHIIRKTALRLPTISVCPCVLYVASAARDPPHSSHAGNKWKSSQATVMYRN
jgi:hypothetical protein